MKDWQSEFIRRKMSELQKYTTVHVGLIAKFNSVLDEVELDQMECEERSRGRIAKAALFYSILSRKDLPSEENGADLYAYLIKALEDTKQQKPASILKEGDTGNGRGEGKEYPAQGRYEINSNVHSNRQSSPPKLQIAFRDDSDATTVFNAVETKLRKFACVAVNGIIDGIILEARNSLRLDESVNDLVYNVDPKQKVSRLFDFIRSKQELAATEDQILTDFLMILINYDNSNIANPMEEFISSKGAIIIRK